MGFWKILGGIAAGVGAVALLPVAGAVGAVTATGAIVGGAVGAAVAAGTDDEDEKKRLRAENERTAAKCALATSKAQQVVKDASEKVAKAQKQVKKAEQRAAAAENRVREAAEIMERYRESLKDVESHYQLVIALTAIGMAAAYADGTVDERETGEMDEYISGIAAAKLPAKVKARIQYLHNHPPTFDKALSEIAKLDRNGLPVDAFRQLIVDVINADGVVDANEKLFLTKWDDMVANRMVPVKAAVRTGQKDKVGAPVKKAISHGANTNAKTAGRSKSVVADSKKTAKTTAKKAVKTAVVKMPAVKSAKANKVGKKKVTAKK